MFAVSLPYQIFAAFQPCLRKEPGKIKTQIIFRQQFPNINLYLPVAIRVEKRCKMYDLVDYGTYLEGLKPQDKMQHKKNYYFYQSLPKELKSPMVILIFGNKIAQILWSEQSFAFVLESAEIKESFMKYFHYFRKK